MEVREALEKLVNDDFGFEVGHFANWVTFDPLE